MRSPLVSRTRELYCLATALIAFNAVVVRADDTKPHGGMLRYPDISATQIVFSYGNDLWVAPRTGGVATPLASPPGPEVFPKFSPDGKVIAFCGNYDGNRDLYTIPIEGGVPTRVTYHPTLETLDDWTPDGKQLIYSASGFMGQTRARSLLTTPATGGLPTLLPVPYGATAAISEDGKWLAYTPHTIDNRTWKRYRGGMQTDIWLFNLNDKTAKRVTDWEGTDSLPMWHGQKLYYMSDNGAEHRNNIWVYDTATSKSEQVTKFNEWDVKWPSIGPGDKGQGEIIFQYGADLMVLDLATKQTRVVDIRIPGDRPTLRPQQFNAADNIDNWSASSTGKRGVIEARGDIWTIPAKEGSARNLTRTPGVAERSPAWSPDGQWIAYFSDKSGEYQLYIRQSDGVGEERQLTKDNAKFLFNPYWSPDSKRIAYQDCTGAIFVHTIDNGETKLVARTPWAENPGMSWSSDSRWLAFSQSGNDEANTSAIWLYEIENGSLHQITASMFNDSRPTFDRKGDYLYFVSSRDFSDPVYEDIGTTFVYNYMQRIYAIPLRKDMTSPLAPKSDEEKWGKDKEKDEKKDDGKKDEEKKDGAESKPADNDKKDATSQPESDKSEEKKSDEKKVEPIKIDLDDMEHRAVMLPIERGRFGNLEVNDKGAIIYARFAAPHSNDKNSIKIFDVSADEKEEKQVASDVAGFSISADGKKLMIRKGDGWAMVDAAADQKLDKLMSKGGMNVLVPPREEWAQMFNDGWRILRDYFYDPGMHGVDWKKIHDHYAQMLPDCVTRGDLSYVIREMISELNVGHAYYQTGFEGDPEPSTSVGMLACDFELADGAYRIKKIYEGGPWDVDARGPLSQPGVNVKEGDYLLAVNDTPLDTTRDPWAAFVGLADRVAKITVSDKPKLDDSARTVTLKLLGDDSYIRFRSWIEANRKYVDQKTGGKVGYVYVPDTGINGQNNLFRQYYSQFGRHAMIIDERWNGGGQIPTRFIELMNRPRTNYWARRDGHDWPWPPDSHLGPKCMLINGLSGSGGDAFPAYFKQSKIGKVLGTRTWGGLVGLSGNPGLIDGAGVTAPTFAFYENDGTWGIEGHGVDPDVEVVDDPSKMQNGADPQLDAAIQLMLKELDNGGYNPPKRPAYPDRSGMGIKPEDK